MSGPSRRMVVSGSTAFGALALLDGKRRAMAQQWPTQNLRFICPFPPGSSADLIVRYFANKIGPLAGKTIIVENRIGAAGNIATEYVARSKPDGYTILLHGGHTIASMMSLMKNPPVDVAKTIQMAATINRQAFMLVVSSNSPYQTLADLTKGLVEKGDRASYGTATGDGTIIAEIYKAKMGLKVREINYRTATDSANDMSSGVLDFAVQNPLYSLGQMSGGKLRILGVASRERLEALPNLPTMNEQGIPMNVIGWWSASVRAGTPKAIIETINKWFVEVVSTDETRKFLATAGSDPFSLSPESAQELMLSEIDKWREYVRIAKIQPQG